MQHTLATVLLLVVGVVVGLGQAIPVKDVNKYCHHKHVDRVHEGRYRASECQLTCTAQPVMVTNSSDYEITYPGVLCGYQLNDYCRNGDCPDQSNAQPIHSSQLAYADTKKLVGYHGRGHAACFVPSDFDLLDVPLKNRSRCIQCGGNIHVHSEPGTTQYLTEHLCLFEDEEVGNLDYNHGDGFLLESYAYGFNRASLMIGAQLYRNLSTLLPPNIHRVVQVGVDNELKTSFDDDGALVQSVEHSLVIAYTK